MNKKIKFWIAILGFFLIFCGLSIMVDSMFIVSPLSYLFPWIQWIPNLTLVGKFLLGVFLLVSGYFLNEYGHREDD